MKSLAAFAAVAVVVAVMTACGAADTVRAIPTRPLVSLAEPTPTVSATDGASCTGDGYSVSYPAGWFVHPGDETHGIAPCSLFAAEPFEGQRDPDGGWEDAQIVLGTAEGCQGSFEVVLSQSEARIQGFPAWTREMAPGEGVGAGELSAYQYDINLAPDQPCEAGRWFRGRTETRSPGDHEENRRVLDAMMASLILIPPSRN